MVESITIGLASCIGTFRYEDGQEIDPTGLISSLQIPLVINIKIPDKNYFGTNSLITSSTSLLAVKRYQHPYFLLSHIYLQKHT